jgi:hypothetical protein
MNSAMKYIKVPEQAIVWKEINSKQTNEYNKFSTALEKTIETVIELDNTFSLLNAQLILITPANFAFKGDNSDESTAHLIFKSGEENNEGLSVGNGNKKSRSVDEDHSIQEIINKIAKLGDGAIKVSSTLGELPPAVNSLKKAISIISDINEGGKGIARLFKGLEEGIVSTEAISTAGELIAVASGVAEAGVAFGPPGWIIGAGALITNGIAAVAASQKVNNPYDPKEFTPDKWQKYYWDRELKKDREKMIELNQPSNYKQLEVIEDDLNANFFVQNRLKRVEQALAEQSYDVYNYRHKQVLKIPEIYLPVSDRLGLTGKNIWDINLNNGNNDQVEQDLQTKNNDFYQFANVASKPKLVIEPPYRIPDEEEWEATLKKINDIPIQPVLKNRGGQNNRQSYSSKNPITEIPPSKVINININKPMIENLVINTKRENEGLNDFKHKVEEVLLEILNSANAIK